MSRARRNLLGLLLVGLGIAFVLVVATGDSAAYVRDVMRLPLVAAGLAIAGLGVATVVGYVRPAHAPQSIVLVAVAIVFVTVVRPGPLSVQSGSVYDADQGRIVPKEFTIPTSALVGVDADPSEVVARAVPLDAAQVRYGALELSDEFDRVAFRTIGQVDVDGDDQSLVRFRIACCAADALRISLALETEERFELGTWVEVTGQWDGDVDRPGIVTASIEPIEQPSRPYLTFED